MAENSRIDHAKILALKASGLTTQEIAQRLGCSRLTARYWSDQEYRSKCLKHKREYERNRYKTDPENRAKRLKYAKERYHSNPEYRAKLFEHQREYFRKRYRSDPEFRAKYLKKREYFHRRYHSDPEYRAKRLDIIENGIVDDGLSKRN